MPKHIVKKIWIIIIVIYIAVSAGSVFYINYRNSVKVENCNNYWQSRIPERTYAPKPTLLGVNSTSVPIPTDQFSIPADACNFWFNPNTGLAIATIIFIGSLILGIIINSVIELFHLIYLKSRKKIYHTIRYGLFINMVLALIIFTIVLFLILPQVGF